MVAVPLKRRYDRHAEQRAERKGPYNSLLATERGIVYVLDSWRFSNFDSLPPSLAELRGRRRSIDATLAAVASPEVETLGDSCRRSGDMYLLAIQQHRENVRQSANSAQRRETWSHVESDRARAHAAVGELERRIREELGRL